MNKSTRYFITISLLTVLALSSFVGAATAFIPGNTPAGTPSGSPTNNNVVGNTPYVVSEGTASTDNLVGSTNTTGGTNWQYSYDVNQFGCETGLYSAVSIDCTSLPGYSASPVCSVAVTPADCTYDQDVQALPPGTDVVFNANASLRIAMDDYGEFVSTTTNTGQCSSSATSTSPAECGVAGLAYGSNEKGWTTTESFASTNINPKDYIQGWTFQMNYTRTGTPYAVLAESIFGDFTAPDTGRGVFTWFTGSKCPGYDAADPPCANPGDGVTPYYVGSLIPTGIQVLYDSQTLSVFRTTVTVWDGHFSEAIANITITAVYNKESKTVIVYKDLKILLDTKILDSIQAISFSERYELDLAANENPTNGAFIHYYHSVGLNQSTVYQYPLTGSSDYDIINAFDAGYHVNFFAAYWPNATEYSVYSILVPGLTGATGSLIPSGTGPVEPCYSFITCDAALPTGTHIADIPKPTGEPSTPWIIVQWMYNQAKYPAMLHFMAKNAPNREMRFVEVLGLTDLGSGTTGTTACTLPATTGIPGCNPYPSRDANAPITCLSFGTGKCPYGGKNQIGVEVQYLLQQIFNPASLNTINGQDFVASENSVQGNDLGCYNGAGPSIQDEDQTFSANCNQPFLWTAVGQTSQAVDSAGSALLSAMQRQDFKNSADSVAYPAPFALLDKNSTALGSIPYALCELTSTSVTTSKAINGPNACTGTTNIYTSLHSNSGTKTGLDTTTLYSSYMQNFYDSNVENIAQAQPILGGCTSPANETTSYESWFMPAKSPFTESWGTDESSVCAAGSLEATYGNLASDTGLYLYTNVPENPNGIITVGGPKANGVTAYFNDFNFALDRDGTDLYSYISPTGAVSGTAPNNNLANPTLDFFPVSSWKSSSNIADGFNANIGYSDTNNSMGFAVVSLSSNVVGLRGLSVYGWNGRDTYWASAWVSQWLGTANGYYNNPFNWLPKGVVSIVLAINYTQSTAAPSTWEPASFTVVEALGTITQLGFNAFLNSNAGLFDQASFNYPTTTWTGAEVPWATTHSANPAIIDYSNNVNLYECSSGYLSVIHSVGFDWFSTKLPTCTTASVQFDG